MSAMMRAAIWSVAESYEGVARVGDWVCRSGLLLRSWLGSTAPTVCPPVSSVRSSGERRGLEV
jgi:hypothetical protein